jgi:hypothetical protein
MRASSTTPQHVRSEPDMIKTMKKNQKRSEEVELALAQLLRGSKEEYRMT